jgi:hypothetical protein
MRARILFVVVISGLLLSAAWFVHGPGPSQATEIPVKYRETVRKGLEYLVRNQAEDGHWEGDGGKHPVAMTGLVGLALLMELDKNQWVEERGDREAKYAAQIRKAADWLMAKSQPGRDGLIFSGHASETERYMQGHGFATLFLAGACKAERDDRRRKPLIDVLTRAVSYILKSRSTQGGWYHTSCVEGHDFDSILGTVIQLHALQAADNAGIPVPGETLNTARGYLIKALEKEQGATETAAALACFLRRDAMFGDGRVSAAETQDELHLKALKHCRSHLPAGSEVKFGRDELAHHYYAHALCNLSSSSWIAYRTPLFDHLLSSQSMDGSWPAGDGIGVGRVYSTALWCTVLQLDNRSHPSMRRSIVTLVTMLGRPEPSARIVS